MLFWWHIFRRRQSDLKKGFTLIEIIVVMSLFSIVGLGISSTFISGMKTWDRVRRMNLTRGNVFFAMETMAGELRQSVDIPQINFEGEERWMSFPTRVGEDIFKVVYLFDSDNKAIFRRHTRLVDVDKEKEAGDHTEKRILKADNFSLQYFSFDQERETYSWEDAWEEDNGPFSAVRFLIEKDDETFSKTVFVPVAG